jgi:hypothetical protein
MKFSKICKFSLFFGRWGKVDDYSNTNALSESGVPPSAAATTYGETGGRSPRRSPSHGEGGLATPKLSA